MKLQCHLDEKNIDDESQDFFYQSFLLYGVEPNNIDMGMMMMKI